jgi:hypothetical protein
VRDYVVYSQICTSLRRLGFLSFYEYPGYISIREGFPGQAWCISNSNATWMMDLQTDDGVVIRTADLGIPSSSQDVPMIVDKIVYGIRVREQ